MSRQCLVLTTLLLVTGGRAEESLPGDWAFRPPKRPALPSVARGLSIRNPIDSFVAARLQAKGLSLAPEADRPTLIRRASLDLCGLPPTPEQIVDFLSDQRPDAYDRLIDRLLGSPHFGEHFARAWLDVARFTESQGFERDKPRENAWQYRDYVIRSFNNDLPFDRFIMEQVAGDLLPESGTDGIVATGFLVAGPYDEVGHNSASPSVRARTREDELEDIVSTVAQAFLGMTVHCARCHDHKFDPIPQREYYRIRSVFDAVRPGDRHLLTEAERSERQARRVQIDREIERRLDRMRSLESKVASAQGPWSRTTGEFQPPRPIARWSFENGARDEAGSVLGKLHGNAQVANGRLILDGQGSFLETDSLPRDLREKTLEAWVVLPDRSQRGGAVISLVTDEGRVFDAIVFGEMQPGRWLAGSDFLRRSREHDGAIENAAPHDRIHLAVTYDPDGRITVYRNGRRYFEPYVPPDPAHRKPTFAAGVSRIFLGLRHPGAQNGFLKGEIEEARLYDRALTPQEIEESYRGGPAGVDEAQWPRLLTEKEEHERREIESDLAKHRREYESLQHDPQTYAAKIQPAKPARVLHRGDFDKEGDVVAPGGLSAIRSPPSDFGLPPDAPEAERRLAFARWLVHPQNPLTARVAVNRIWQRIFGTGLVDSPSDFGSLGERPSHPELLDWLTCEFVESGWSVKRLVRLIVTSTTYRQSGRWDRQAAELDPENRLLWRYPVRRLEAEAIRDSMLAVSGELNRRLGGPSFRPFNIRIFNSTFYDLIDEDREEWNRRTIYRMQIQSAKDPVLECFDCPEPSVRTPKRASTTTPLQALALMNSHFVQRRVHAMARQLESSGDPVAAAYRRAYGRDPTARERYRGEELRREGGLSSLCWVLLNSSEFLYVR